MEEWQKCAKDFSYFCHKYIKIGHPKRGLVPSRLYNYQRRVIGEYGEHQYNIISKFRQGGLTTVSVIWGMWRCMFHLDEVIMVLSKTDREAIAAGEIAARALEHLPAWLVPDFGKHNEHSRHFKETGSWLYFYTPEAARGKSITYLIIDEAAFIPDMRRHWKAMYPTLATGGNCIAISTVNGLGNWYEEQYTRAKNNKNEFNIIDLDYWEHPDYHDDEWVRKTKANLGPKGWKQEVLREFLGSGDTYIPADVISRLIKETMESPPSRKLFPEYVNRLEDENDVDFENGAFWVWREPVDGHDYIIGVDCAEGLGEEGDNSVFQVLDVSTLEQVAEFYSNEIPPHIFAQLLNEVGIMYNTAIIVVEAAAPAGGAVLTNLQHKLFYENLYWDNERKRAATPGIKSNQTIRPMLLESISSRLLDNTLKINGTRFVNELKTFIYNGQRKRAEAQYGKHDDAIMAMAIGLYARDTLMRGVPLGSEIPIELSDTMDSQVYQSIKEELKRGAPHNWLDGDDDDEDLVTNPEDTMPGIVFNYRRKYDKLLKEFAW